MPWTEKQCESFLDLSYSKCPVPDQRMQEKLLKALPGHWSARDLDDWFARRHAKALLEAQVRGEMNLEVFTAVRAPFPGVLAIDSPQHTLQRACAWLKLTCDRPTLQYYGHPRIGSPSVASPTMRSSGAR